MHFVDTQLTADMVGRALVIAGQHDGAYAQRMQPVHGLPAFRLDGIAKGQHANQRGRFPELRQPGHRGAALLLLARLRAQGIDAHAMLGHHALVTQGQRLPIHLRRHAIAGHRFHILRRCRGDVFRLGGIAHGPRQRVFAALLDGRRQRQQPLVIAIGGDMGRQSRMPHRQCPRLVEGHHLHPVQQFQRFGVLDQDAMASRHAGAGHDGGRRRQAQCTRAGDHQHRHRVEDGRTPAGAGQPPADAGDGRNGDDGRHENGADLVHHALDGRLGRLRILHGADNARQRRFGSHCAGAGHEHALAVDGAADHFLARAFADGQALAGQHGFVDVGAAFQDHAVHRNAFAGTHLHLVAHPQRARGNLAPCRAVAHARRVGPQRLQRADGLRRLALGARLQPLAQPDQRDDDGRRLEIQVHHAARLGQPQVQAQAVGGRSAQRHQ